MSRRSVVSEYATWLVATGRLFKLLASFVALFAVSGTANLALFHWQGLPPPAGVIVIFSAEIIALGLASALAFSLCWDFPRRPWDEHGP